MFTSVDVEWMAKAQTDNQVFRIFCNTAWSTTPISQGLTLFFPSPYSEGGPVAEANLCARRVSWESWLYKYPFLTQKESKQQIQKETKSREKHLQLTTWA